VYEPLLVSGCSISLETAVLSGPRDLPEVRPETVQGPGVRRKRLVCPGVPELHDVVRVVLFHIVKLYAVNKLKGAATIGFEAPSMS
jgi:hypothetical protein